MPALIKGRLFYCQNSCAGKEGIMEETGNGKMIVITGGKVNDANAYAERIANLNGILRNDN